MKKITIILLTTLLLVPVVKAQEASGFGSTTSVTSQSQFDKFKGKIDAANAKISPTIGQITLVKGKSLVISACNNIELRNIDIAKGSTFVAKTNNCNTTETKSAQAAPTVNVLQNIDDDAMFIIVSPNPNNGIFTIETIGQTIVLLDISIYDFAGKKVLNKKPDSNNKSIDISKFPKGVYLVKVTANSSAKTFKVVYQ